MITVTQISDASGTLVFPGATSIIVQQVAGTLQVTANEQIALLDTSLGLQAKIDSAKADAQTTVTNAQKTVTDLS